MGMSAGYDDDKKSGGWRRGGGEVNVGRATPYVTFADEGSSLCELVM